MGTKCIGVDIGGTTVKLGIFETTGELICKWEVPTRRDEGGRYILPDVADSVLTQLKENGISKEDVVGAGMGVPGPVMPDGYVKVCVNLGWKDLYPARELEDLLGFPVKIGNDANVASLGEMWQGGGKGVENMVMVTLGTGVGSGVIMNGQIVTGCHGLAGEIGHFHVRDDETETCGCGGKGCLEQQASATGIVKEARRLLASTDEPSAMREYGDTLSAKDVFDEAKNGDKLAVQVAEGVGYYMGLGLALVTLTIDPELYVIGGGVSAAGPYLIDLIRKNYEALTPLSPDKAKIVLATLGNNAGIYGGARLAMS